jgi:Rap1a immunity proteins
MNQIRAVTAAIIIAGLGASDVHAQTIQKATGPYQAGYLRDACRTAIQADANPGVTGRAIAEGTCGGAISTVLHLGPAMNQQYRFCPPPGTTLKQAIPILLKFLDDNPVMLDYDIRDVANFMGRKTWPCQ